VLLSVGRDGLSSSPADLMRRNLLEVFNEPDPARRAAVIAVTVVGPSGRTPVCERCRHPVLATSEPPSAGLSWRDDRPALPFRLSCQAA